MKLQDVNSATLKQAIGIYMRLAYRGGNPTEAVRQRADLPAGLAGAELLGDDRFERVPPEARAGEAQRYNLRLGNAVYLHMKLTVERIERSDDYVLRVDTHDKHFSAMVQDKERDQFAELLSHNRRLQSEIEREWTAAGLPTFEAYLRGQMTRMTRPGAERREG